MKGVRLITFVNFLFSIYNNVCGEDNMECKNKVIDYLPPKEVCRIIGISTKSTAQITRWMKDGRIVGAFKFGKTIAIPISWVKSECLTRGIDWNGVQVEEDKIGVSLKDYEPLIDYAKKNNVGYGTIHNQITRGTFEGDYIRFDTSFGIRK